VSERPGFLAWLARTAARAIVIILAAGAVAGVVYLLVGAPEAAREYRQDEVARFAPTLAHGLGQLAGEAFLLALVVYASRRWCKVRL